jgi:hypothetical protein
LQPEAVIVVRGFELAVPPNGFGMKLDAMYAFHRERNLEAHRGRGERRDNQDYVRFANRGDAEDFAKVFGGKST